jgi:26S proteasome regulatory subunit N10
MREEQARQAAREQALHDPSSSSDPTSTIMADAPPPTSEASAASSTPPVTEMAPKEATTTAEVKDADVEMAGHEDEEMDEEEAIAKAIEMSMKTEEDGSGEGK